MLQRSLAENSIELYEVVIALLGQFQILVFLQHALSEHTCQIVLACLLAQALLQLIGRERWCLVLLLYVLSEELGVSFFALLGSFWQFSQL